MAIWAVRLQIMGGALDIPCRNVGGLIVLLVVTSETETKIIVIHFYFILALKVSLPV